jgi:CubicO group peptidase (beta-lactamase class C family)
MRDRISTVGLCLLWCSASAGCAAPQKTVGSILRLDGTTISVAEAEEFARTTLRNAHVTGAQIAVVDQARLVWSEAFGRRRRDPELPMDRVTTMWAASITRACFRRR